jgi:CheY-like chemotaxis protein
MEIPVLPLSILIVDDDPDTVDSLADFLTLSGYAVRKANSATSALQEIAADMPDVVFLDIGMPGMDGWELADRLNKAAKPMFLVAITGHSDEEDREQSINCGIHLHLVKPADPALLLDVLKRFEQTIVRLPPL